MFKYLKFFNPLLLRETCIKLKVIIKIKCESK